MWSQLIEELANEHDMHLTAIQRFSTQAEADALVRALYEDDRIAFATSILQFASGYYFVVVFPNQPGDK